MGWSYPSPDGYSRERFRVSWDWLERRYGLQESGSDDADQIRRYLHNSASRKYILIDPKHMYLVREIMEKANDVLSRPGLPGGERLAASNIAKRAKKWLEDV